jgi:mannose-6-phosphate isomerase-like protein (cupin superfamily)
MVSVLGLKNAIVVETDDVGLVADQSNAQAVKDIFGTSATRSEANMSPIARVYRPRGWYEAVDAGERFQVKRIMVKPGAMLSLQMHHHRAEHRVVVAGTARIIRNADMEPLAENDRCDAPPGEPQEAGAASNRGAVGGYLGEDDIVRIEDTYKRGDSARRGLHAISRAPTLYGFGSEALSGSAKLSDQTASHGATEVARRGDPPHLNLSALCPKATEAFHGIAFRAPQ